MLSEPLFLITSKNFPLTTLINEMHKIEKTRYMRTIYRINSTEIGEVLLKRRKIAKALRWWLRENGYTYTSTIF